MVTKKKIAPKEEIIEGDKMLEEIEKTETKAQYENRREFEVLISEKTYYKFNEIGINRKFRKFLESIKIKFSNKKVERTENFKINCSVYKEKINKIWEKYIEIWNYYINKEFSYENSIGYEQYINCQIGDKENDQR